MTKNKKNRIPEVSIEDSNPHTHSWSCLPVSRSNHLAIELTQQLPLSVLTDRACKTVQNYLKTTHF